MGPLEFAMLILFVITVLFNLATNEDYAGFIGAVIIDSILLAITYVILHFLLKYW